MWFAWMNTKADPGPLLALILLAGPTNAATVLSVGDGDTVRVSERAKRITIRLARIDAPETAQGPLGSLPVRSCGNSCRSDLWSVSRFRRKTAMGGPWPKASVMANPSTWPWCKAAKPSPMDSICPPAMVAPTWRLRPRLNKPALSSRPAAAPKPHTSRVQASSVAWSYAEALLDADDR